MAYRSPKRFFFSLGRRNGFRVPQLGTTDLLTHGDQFPHQFTEAAVFGDLRFGTFDGRALGNNLGDRLSTDSMSQRIGRTVSQGILLGTVAVGLAALTETGRQETGTQVIDLGQRAAIRARLSRSAFKAVGIGTSCLTVTIACQIRRENSAQTLSDFDPDSYVVHPSAGVY
jgi:hypothetical protein